MPFKLLSRPDGVIREVPSIEAVKRAQSVGLDPEKGVRSELSSSLSYQLSRTRFLIFTKDGRAKIVCKKLTSPIAEARPVGDAEIKTLVSKMKFSI